MDQARGRSDQLGRLYREHNSGRGRGFLFGGQERVEGIKAFLPLSPGRTLDIGCRDGSLATSLGLSPATTVGIDIDQEALEYAHKNGFEVLRVDLWDGIPFRSGSFDLVVMGEVLEHLPFSGPVMTEIARVLRVGGRVVGSVPNAFRLKNRLRFLAGREYELDPTHLRQFSPSRMRRVLEEHFHSVEVQPCVGRLVRVSPRLFGNDLVWAGTR